MILYDKYLGHRSCDLHLDFMTLLAGLKNLIVGCHLKPSRNNEKSLLFESQECSCLLYLTISSSGSSERRTVVSMAVATVTDSE